MREHQIIINLKPEQFQEVQRLARQAGSRSVSTFVRERLLNTLGLGKDGGPSPERAQTDLRLVTSELKRLHRELQVFVAESLTANDLVYGQEPMSQPKENFLTRGVPELADSAWDYYADESNYVENTAPPPQDVPVAFSEQGDDLEDLADRAFAISPRLGAAEPYLDSAQTGQRAFPDPLQELLQDALLGGVQALEQDDELFVDQSDYEAELSAYEAESMALAEETMDETKMAVDEETALDQPLYEDMPLNDSALLDEEAYDQPADDDEDSDPPPSPPRPPIPPFSGGPPPRKRQT